MQLFGRKISGISYQRRPFSASAPLFGFEMSTTQKCRQECVMVSEYWCGHFVLSSSNDPITIRCTNNNKGLSIHAKSSLTLLPSNAYEVKELLNRHDSRVQIGDVPNPASAILPFRSITDTIKDLRPINQCYYSPPATFTIQFEVAHILPAFIPTSSNPLNTFCMKPKDGSSKLQFSPRERCILRNWYPLSWKSCWGYSWNYSSWYPWEIRPMWIGYLPIATNCIPWFSL